MLSHKYIPTLLIGLAPLAAPLFADGEVEDPTGGEMTELTREQAFQCFFDVERLLSVSKDIVEDEAGTALSDAEYLDHISKVSHCASGLGDYIAKYDSVFDVKPGLSAHVDTNADFNTELGAQNEAIDAGQLTIDELEAELARLKEEHAAKVQARTDFLAANYDASTIFVKDILPTVDALNNILTAHEDHGISLELIAELTSGDDEGTLMENRQKNLAEAAEEAAAQDDSAEAPAEETDTPADDAETPVDAEQPAEETSESTGEGEGESTEEQPTEDAPEAPATDEPVVEQPAESSENL